MNKIISYSQYREWMQCPFRWYLLYPENYRKTLGVPSIHLVFGQAIHETIQYYVSIMYNDSLKEANKIDLDQFFREAMKSEYDKVEKKYKDKTELYVSKRDMIDFYYDGLRILEWFGKNRKELFNSRDEKLLGIEVPLIKMMNESIQFRGYIDILLKNKATGKIRIIDLKTSTKGWNKYKKSDDSTTQQIILYKQFFSELNNVDLKDIVVEYIILKRKLYDDIEYKQKRIVKFVPANGKPTVNKAKRNFETFMNSCFTEGGEYKEKKHFVKIATESNCKFCVFSNMPELCNKKN